MANRSKFHVSIRVLNPGVTGSCILCTIRMHDGCQMRFLVDLGVFQGKLYDELNNSLGFEPESISAIFVTHNHSDHVSRLPLFYRRGGSAKIYCTSGTAMGLPINLADSYKVMRTRFIKGKKELLKANGRGKNGYRSTNPIDVTHPLYSESDIERCLENVVPVNYFEWASDEKLTGVRVKFFPNAHLPGASSVLVEIESCGEKIFLFFTGDWRPENIFQEKFEFPEELRNLPVHVITESTYGSRDERNFVPCFKENIALYSKLGMRIVLPVISQFRAQEILWNLKEMQQEGTLDVNIPLYLVGPLAIEYNNLYQKEDFADIPPEKKEFLPSNFYITTLNDLFDERRVKPIYIVGGGMCSNGPSAGFFTRYIEDSETLFHFSSYCAEDTIGRKLQELEEKKSIEAFGRMFTKNATVKFTSEFSGHGTMQELLRFLANFQDIRSMIVVHGSPDSRENMKNLALKELKVRDVVAANRNEAYVLDRWGVVKVKQILD